MPPKPKFTKEEVAAAALELVKECGVSALTARELGKRLGTSASPIFTVFKSMDEVKWAARARGLREFEEYAGDFGDYTRILAGIIVIGVVITVISTLFGALQKRLTRWS